MNFLSACGCYPGFLVGAKLGKNSFFYFKKKLIYFILGELENFHPWICALAGGMFVYIGLADMV